MDEQRQDTAEAAGTSSTDDENQQHDTAEAASTSST
ncbi:hypothetical protein L915_17687, partial [Phytophthora nicotianae]